MTDLRNKIAQSISDNYQYGGKSIAETADAILALPETAGWTALEAATEELLTQKPALLNWRPNVQQKP